MRLGLSLDDVQGNINDLKPGKPFAVLDLGDDADLAFQTVEEIRGVASKLMRLATDLEIAQAKAADLRDAAAAGDGS